MALDFALSQSVMTDMREYNHTAYFKYVTHMQQCYFQILSGMSAVHLKSHTDCGGYKIHTYVLAIY